MARGRWIIETRTPETEERRAGDWTRDGLGEEEARTTYASRAAAERQIKALRKIWADSDAEYRARELGGAPVYVPEAQRSATAGKVGSIRMPADAWARLDAYAAQLGVGRGAAVAALLAELVRAAG